MNIPVLTHAKDSTILLYGHLRAVEDNVNAFPDAPMDAAQFYEAIVADGRRVYGR